MIRELTENMPKDLNPFNPFPPASDRAFWSSLPMRVRSSLMETGDGFLKFTYPPLPATLFMEFVRTGNRVNFEEPYFLRRHALNSLVLAECARGDGRYLDDIINGIDAVCSESAWQLPAHNGYLRDTPQLILPDTSRPVLDLFSCETGAQLAMVRLLLKDRLDEVSPFVCGRILNLLEERILDPYLTEHFWWMGNGDEPMCNWTPWCTQNVLIVAGTIDRRQDELRAVLGKAAYGLDCFLKDYGEDGCCNEGAKYYRHAGLCLFGALEVMNAVTSGAFASLYREPKIRNIALYIVAMHVRDGYYFNFADCSPVAGRAGAREYLFGKRIGSREMMEFAAVDYRKPEVRQLSDEINLYYRVQAAKTAAEMNAFAREDISVPGYEGIPSGGTRPGITAPADDDTSRHRPDVWYPSVGVFIARSTRFDLAVKAGGNGDSHNHNDTGSFILYLDGRPCVIDVGVETYTAKTFSPSRYEIWTMRSSYHNLPTFGTCGQLDGAAFRARDVCVSPGDGTSSVSMEIAGAYPPECGVRSYVRTVSLDRTPGRESVTIEDRYEGDAPPVLSLMTSEPPAVTPEGDLRIGDLAEVETGLDAGRIAVETIEIDDPLLRIAWPGRIYRTLLGFDELLTLRVRCGGSRSGDTL